jgi:ATP-dependent Lon protease
MVIRARRLHQDALDEIAFDDEPKDSAASPLADEERQRQYAERLSSLHDSVAIGTVSIPPSAQGRKEAPADLIKKHYVEDYLPESSEYVRVFDRRKLEQIAAASAGISDCNSRIEPLLLNALAHGGFRLRAALSPQITERLHLLIEDFPNFDAVLEEIAEDVWLNLHRPVHARRFSPLLLAGPPGIGKTTVVDEISKRMGFSIEKIGVAGLTAGFVLVGADASWSSAKPGLIAASVARTAILDRIIVFDEIDKLRSDDRFPVLPVLLELLEPQTASRFKDHFLNIELDLTSAFVVATANDLSRIPQALLSRFKVVNVRPPDYEQRRRVIHSVLRRGFPEFTLEESLVDRLADSITDLRRLKRVLSKLFAVAARRSFAQTGSVQSSVTATQWDANRSGVFK